MFSVFFHFMLLNFNRYSPYLWFWLLVYFLGNSFSLSSCLSAFWFSDYPFDYILREAVFLCPCHCRCRCFLVGPLPTRPPLSLCFGSQVSIRSLLASFQFLLLPRFYRELGCDLPTSGLEFELPCPFTWMYIIIVCGPPISMSLSLAYYVLVYWYDFTLIVVSNQGVPLVGSTKRSVSSPFMVRGHGVQALWPMASPINFVFGNGYHHSVKHLILILFLALFAVCWGWWRGSQLFALFCFVPNSYSTLLLNLKRLCGANYSELKQSHSSIVLSQAHDEVFIASSLPEACARILFLCWICWFCLFSHLCCTQRYSTCWSFCVSCSSMYLFIFHPFYFVWNICGSIVDIFVFQTFCIIWVFFFSTCWVWRSVAQLACPSGSSPSSGHGLFLNLVCCWKDMGTFCLFFLKWLCAARSQELR